MTFDSSQYLSQVNASVRTLYALLGISHGSVPIALTLGSGLGELAKNIDAEKTVDYGELRFFRVPTVAGHAGKLIYGKLAGVPVIALSGRTHYYEVADKPHGIMDVVFATHVMASLGVRTLMTTNAVGGLNLGFEPGDLMVIEDHFSKFMPDPTAGPFLDFGGNAPFQPMAHAYDRTLGECFQQASGAHAGTYAALPGRTYETSLECRILRDWGIDAVGMSTVPEVIVARNRGMKVLGISLVTNVIGKSGVNATNHEEVQEVANDPAVQKRISTAYVKLFDQFGHYMSK